MSRHRELGRVVLACSAFFLLLCGYYILRPVRDAMGVRTGIERLPWLFTGTLIATALIVPAFGWVVKHVSRGLLLPSVYGFLCANLVGFQVAFSTGASVVTAASFFVWLSVFNLFVVSLFWSSVSDTFGTAGAKRFYGVIAAGGTAGAIAGPAATAFLATRVSTSHLLALSAMLLAGAAACMVVLRRTGGAPGEPAAERPIGGSILAGIPLAVRLPSLRGVAVLVICYSVVSTVLYFELVAQIGRRYGSTGERTAIFAGIDMAANLLALAVQLAGTRRIINRLGLAGTLVTVPLLVLIGLCGLLVAPSVVLLALVLTVHRAGDYSLMRPGREVLFTTVAPESRYKAKSFIDTAVYRSSDALSAWVVSAVRTAGVSTILLIGLPLALLWASAGLRTGKRHDASEPT